MTEQQTTRATFTASDSGTYHVVTGMQPHLLFTECSAECGTSAADGSAVPVVVEFDTVEPTAA